MISADEAFSRKPVSWESRVQQINEASILKWTERQFQDEVVGAAKRLGWLVYHTHDSRRSQPGFPDLVLVHPRGGVLFRELKAEKGRVRPEQKTWIQVLKASGADAEVWRPAAWADQSIQKRLLVGGAR